MVCNLWIKSLHQDSESRAKISTGPALPRLSMTRVAIPRQRVLVNSSLGGVLSLAGESKRNVKCARQVSLMFGLNFLMSVNFTSIPRTLIAGGITPPTTV